MKWLIFLIIVIIIIFLLYYFRRKIVRKAKLLQSPFKNFTFDEFDSPDEPGSGKKNMSHESIRKIDIARDCATEEKGDDFPFIIEKGGGFRTFVYNKKVDGVKGSAHTKGLAFDIDYKTEEDMEIMLRCLIKVGFNRFGIRWKGSGTSIHVDTDRTKPQYVTWGYKDKDENYVDPPNPWSYA